MSSSESESEGTYESDDSEFNFGSDVRVEFEEPQQSTSQTSREENDVAVAPYADEPLASGEWIRKYQEEKNKSEIICQDLQNRLDKVIPTSDW